MNIVFDKKINFVFCLGLIIILSWIYGDYLFTNTLLGDISPLHHELSEKSWFFQNLKEGTFTWLDPRNDLGHPLLANPTNGLVYFLNLFYFIDPAFAYKLIFIFHYMVLAFGIHRLIGEFLKDLVLKKSLVLMLMACGIVWSLPIHVAIAPIAYFPWLIVSMIHYSQSATISNAIKSGVLSGFVFVLGDPFLIPVAFLTALPTLKINQRFLKTIPIYLLSFFLLSSANFLEMIQLWSFNARSSGFTDWESLSYSTNPHRILEIFFPWAKIESNLGIGFHRQWWFPRIGIGIVLLSMATWGLWTNRLKKQTVCFFLLSFFFLQLAFGQFSPMATWMMNHLFWFIRYPERFLAYSFILLIPLMASGLQAFMNHSLKKFLPLIILISLAENLFPGPVNNVVPASQLNALKEKSIASQSSRIFGCQFGADGRLNTPLYFDLRAQGISMANAESNTFSPVLKNSTCPWVLTPEVRAWLGISHFLTPPTNPTTREYMLNQGLRSLEQTSHGELWSSANTSPLLGQWISDWSKGEFALSNFKQPFNGHYSIDLIQDNESIPRTNCANQKLKLQVSHPFNKLVLSGMGNCQGLLSLPWSYHPSWNVSESDSQQSPTLLRINQATLGIVIPKGATQISIQYEDGPKPILFSLSILCQLCFIIWILWSFVPLKVSKGKNPILP